MSDNNEAMQPEWQPIETAPRDGTIISLTSSSPLWKYPFPAKWCEKQGFWIFADHWLNDVCGVSDLVDHWMPLPAPPEDRSAS